MSWKSYYLTRLLLFDQIKNLELLSKTNIYNKVKKVHSLNNIHTFFSQCNNVTETIKSHIKVN